MIEYIVDSSNLRTKYFDSFLSYFLKFTKTFLSASFLSRNPTPIFVKITHVHV